MQRLFIAIVLFLIYSIGNVAHASGPYLLISKSSDGTVPWLDEPYAWKNAAGEIVASGTSDEKGRVYVRQDVKQSELNYSLEMPNFNVYYEVSNKCWTLPAHKFNDCVKILDYKSIFDYYQYSRKNRENNIESEAREERDKKINNIVVSLLIFIITGFLPSVMGLWERPYAKIASWLVGLALSLYFFFSNDGFDVLGPLLLVYLYIALIIVVGVKSNVMRFFVVLVALSGLIAFVTSLMQIPFGPSG